MNNKSKKWVALIFVILVLSIIILSYFYLAGKLPSIHGYKTVVYFKNVSGLKPGAPVLILGLEKGRVTAVELVKGSQLVRVTILLDKNITLTQDSKFAISSLSYFGTDRILTIFPGREKIADRTTEFYGINQVLDLEEFFLKFNNLIIKLESVPINETIKSLKTELITNLWSLSEKFSSPVTELSQQLRALNTKLDSLQILLQAEGTVKKLLLSDELYLELKQTNQKLQGLIEDIKNNPQKYIQLKMF